MSGFALHLDLTLFFEDLRKFSCVFVNVSKFKEVGDVEKHIKSVFKLDDNICLTNKKFLIPGCEDIQILQQYETLKVQKCDFFDHQIHKNKRTNNACDQTALNLIQTERTIDLSCRPKQSLKINICQNHCISGVPMIPFSESGKIQTISRPSTSTNNFMHETCQTQYKEKQRLKKKRLDAKDDTEVVEGIENGIDILDMSVKKTRRKKYENCFSPDGSLEADVKPPHKPFKTSENKNLFELAQEKSTVEFEKKGKKRKKQLLNEDFDLASSCWDNLVSDNGSVITDSGNKHKNKSKLKRNDDDVSYEHQFKNEKKEDTCRLVSYEENSPKKKHKKARKSDDLSEIHNTGQTHRDYSNSTEYNKKVDGSSEMNELDLEYIKEGKNTSKISLDEYKIKLLEQFADGNHLFPKSPCSKIDNIEGSSNMLNSHDINKNVDFANISDVKSHSEEQDEKLFTNFTDTKIKRKRIRKHNKKSKRGRRELMLAVGPVLNNLAEQSRLHLPKISSDVAKHTYLTDDFSKEITIPQTTPQTVSQDIFQGSSVNIVSQASVRQEIASDSSTTWQQKLLKLASGGSKPVVFQRSSTSSEKSDQLSQSHQKPFSKTDSSPDFNKENNRLQDDLKCASPRVRAESSNHSSDFKKCNGEIKYVNGTQEEAESTSIETKRKLFDSVKPIPTNVQNIILTNYPIIDNVVADDLILFKVLKVNEDRQPGASKTILAKVIGSTNFPDKVSLLIMEGCEECDHCKRADENAEELIIELRWADILEPRLFYP